MWSICLALGRQGWWGVRKIIYKADDELKSLANMVCVPKVVLEVLSDIVTFRKHEEQWNNMKSDVSPNVLGQVLFSCRIFFLFRWLSGRRTGGLLRQVGRHE